MTSPLNIEIWDKFNQRIGWINDPETVQIVPRHLAIGAATLKVTLDHDKIPMLGAKGSRLQVRYYDGLILSGPVRPVAGQGGPNGSLTYSVESDERLLWRILGWPVPGSGLDSQTVKQDVRSGPAETVLKGYIGANATRLGLPVVVAPDQGRGTTISLGIRMVPLADGLLPKLINSGIGLSVLQEGDHLLVDVYETTVYPYTLTEASGIVQDWSWSTAPPSVTRVVVGGQGEGTARAFTQVTDAAAEAEWGADGIIEGFVDARDVDTSTELPARGQDSLDEGKAQAGLSVQLSETDNFRYGMVNRGDKITLEVGPGITVTDVLTEAVLNLDRETGFTAVPAVGDRSDNTLRRFVQAMLRANRAVRKLGTI